MIVKRRQVSFEHVGVIAGCLDRVDVEGNCRALCGAVLAGGRSAPLEVGRGAPMLCAGMLEV